MFTQKLAMTVAVFLALALAILLVGISYVLFSDRPSDSRPLPKIEPLSDQILWAFQWIGLAAFIALAVVGAILLIVRIRSKKTSTQID